MAVKAVIRAVIKQKANGNWTWRATLKGRAYGKSADEFSTYEGARKNAIWSLPIRAKLKKESPGKTFVKRYRARRARAALQRQRRREFPWDDL